MPPVHCPDRALCSAGLLAAHVTRTSCATSGTSIKKQSEPSEGESLQPSPSPPPTPPVLRVHEANAKRNRACALAGMGLRRAGGGLLKLPDQPGQAGLHGSRRSGRACRMHACTLVCTRDVHMCQNSCCAPRRYIGFPAVLDLGSSHVPSQDRVCAWL